VTTSVARPTTLDHMPAGIAGRVARNVALVRLYEVHSATAPIVLGVVDTNRRRRQLRAITVLAAVSSRRVPVSLRWMGPDGGALNDWIADLEIVYLVSGGVPGNRWGSGQLRPGVHLADRVQRVG
jgi:hypothetical protein